MMVFFVIALLFGGIVGVIAEQKNRPFFPWAVYGACLFQIAIIHIAVIGDKEYDDRQLAGMGYKKCPACAEWVKNEAVLCKHCKTSLSDTASLVQEVTNGQPCRWCQTQYDMEKGNKCPACGGLQKHFLKENPLLLILIFCLISALIIVLSSVENQPNPPLSSTEETTSF